LSEHFDTMQISTDLHSEGAQIETLPGNLFKDTLHFLPIISVILCRLSYTAFYHIRFPSVFGSHTTVDTDSAVEILKILFQTWDVGRSQKSEGFQKEIITFSLYYFLFKL